MNIFNVNYKLLEFVNNKIQHYDTKKYWSMRAKVVNPSSKTNKLLKYYYFFKIKRMDAFNNASIGLNFGSGAYFEEPPFLPHGLKGIFIHPTAVIGKNIEIYQQVTIGQKERNGRAARIGDNCVIGAGAKIIGEIVIGNNVKIGANCVVVKDIPDNSVVVMQQPRIIYKDQQ